MEMKVTYDTPLLTALEQVAPYDHLSLIYESAEDLRRGYLSSGSAAREGRRLMLAWP